MNRCTYCSSWIWPWQRRGEGPVNGERVHWHPECRRRAELPWLHAFDEGYPTREDFVPAHNWPVDHAEGKE